MDKIFKSSANSEKMSATVTGLIVMFGSALIPEFDWQTATGNIVEAILKISEQIGIISGAVITAFGTLRKVWFEIKEIVNVIKTKLK